MAHATANPRVGGLEAPAGLLGRVVRALPQGRGLPAGAWERRHRGLLAILWLHVVAVPAFGLTMGYSVVHCALEGSALLALALAAQWTRLGPRLRSVLVSVGLLTASGLLVHFSGGFVEFHFHFFVMIALLSLYVDWVPFLVAVAYVALHHGIVGVLDPPAVYNHADAIAHPWKWAGIHAGFVLAAGAANVFTWRISEEEARRRENVERVTEAALAKLPLDELLEQLLRRISEAVQAEMASIWLVDPSALTLRAAYGSERPEESITLPLDDGLHARVVQRAEAVAVPDAEPSSLLNPVYRRAGIRALAGAPLMVEGTLIGVLDVANRHPRNFTPADLGLLQLVADRIGPAIDRARLYEEEHRIATTLQRSLLPKRLPQVRGVELSARYLPAGRGIAVGGDWYDAIELDGGQLVLVMGDVAGHGTEAASLMGQLRTATRAYANEGHGPASVATRLNALISGLEDDSMATLLYLQLDTATGLARFANAGHPPPLLRHPSGSAEYVWGRSTAPPLGARRHTLYYEQELTIDPGSTLVLYTDGLVERRDAPLDDGLEALRLRLGEAVATSAADACRDVLGPAELHQALADDVAVLVMQRTDLTGRTLTMEYPAEVSAVTIARRRFEDFLRAAKVPAAERHDIVLSSSEACANAVQHAYGPAGGRFTLAAQIDDSSVQVTISDHGTWRRPNEFSGGGRGLQLMEDLVDSVDVERSGTGTRVTLRKSLDGNANGRAV